ncbi:MAG: hypothetical protein AB7G12_11115 [Thermoanaerobaculia bacterium]
MSAGRWLDPNLARTPFVNDRPVARLAWLLWILAVAAGVGAVVIGLGARRDASTLQAEWVRATAEAATARTRATTLKAALEKDDLASWNERSEFLNQRIAERAFSWNGLFDQMTGLMPRGVRLLNVLPEGFVLRRGSRNANAPSPATTRVSLRLRGEAEDTESLLEFIDRLFADPLFANPNLARESEQKDAHIRFDLSVQYLPVGFSDGEPALVASDVPEGRPVAGAAASRGTVVAKGGPRAAAPAAPAANGEAGATPAGSRNERPAAASPVVGADAAPASRGGLVDLPASRRGGEPFRNERVDALAGGDGGDSASAPTSGRRSSDSGRSAPPTLPGGRQPGLDPSLVFPTPLAPYASPSGGRR